MSKVEIFVITALIVVAVAFIYIAVFANEVRAEEQPTTKTQVCYMSKSTHASYCVDKTDHHG